MTKKEAITYLLSEAIEKNEYHRNLGFSNIETICDKTKYLRGEDDILVEHYIVSYRTCLYNSLIYTANIRVDAVNKLINEPVILEKLTKKEEKEDEVFLSQERFLKALNTTSFFASLGFHTISIDPIKRIITATFGKVRYSNLRFIITSMSIPSFITPRIPIPLLISKGGEICFGLDLRLWFDYSEII
jgi:hypothetical protein